MTTDRRPARRSRHPRLRALLASAVAATAGFAATAAHASPPSGLVGWTDHARAQVVEGARLDLPAGTTAGSSAYTLAPGSDTGWWRARGPSIIAVTAGTLTVRAADGCAVKEYRAGRAAVLPAGRYLLRNAADKPLELTASLLGPAGADRQPLGVGKRQAAPPGCAGMPGYTPGTVPTGVSHTDLARGTFVGSGSYHGHAPEADGIAVAAGRDTQVSTYRIAPGASTGWHTHPGPYFAIVSRGTLNFYSGHDGACDISGSFSPGQVWLTTPGHGHRHIATNEGTEWIEFTAVYFNIHHGGPLPVIGSQLELNDFTPLPPPDCPRLR